MSFRHVCLLFEQYDSNLPVTLSHNRNKKKFLGEGHQDFGTPPPPKKKNAWDPNLTGHVGPRTQIEKS